LTAATHDLLARSAYDSAYIFNILSIEGTRVVYQWDRESGWRRHASSNPRSEHPATESENADLQTIRLLRSLGGPQPGPGSLTDGLGPDFFPELLAAFPDRGPTLDEIAAFERAFRERRKK
jgi:hypothetical protein